MKKAFPIIFLYFFSCVGTDVVDDPIVGQSLMIQQERIELLQGQTETLDLIYKDQYGVEQNINAIWTVGNENIASINLEGTITALNAGQTFVYASFNGVNSDSVMITVVLDQFAVARIEIETPITNQLEIGDSLQLSSIAYNINNEEIDSIDFEWKTNDSSIAIIDQNGLLFALSEGTINIIASSSGLDSTPLQINIGSATSNILTASFMGANGYTAQGTAELIKNGNDEIILTLKDDFVTSFALGTFIYLANSTSGSQVRGSGLELDEINSNGMKTFNVSAIAPNTDLTTYRYVIVLCKPASITFGLADFQL